MLDRDEDIILSGQRHPFLGKYKIAYSSEGKLLACEISLYSNAGYSMDLSKPVRRISFNLFSLYILCIK